MVMKQRVRQWATKSPIATVLIAALLPGAGLIGLGLFLWGWAKYIQKEREGAYEKEERQKESQEDRNPT
jgi:hypothetical protein